MRNIFQTKNKISGITILSKISVVIIIIILLVYCVSLMTPFLWTIMTSFKAYDEYYLRPFQFPEKIVFGNYSGAFSKISLTLTGANGKKITYGVLSMFSYSVLFSTLYAGFVVLWQTLIAYVMARYDFVLKKFIYSLGIFIMVLPIIGNMPSMMQVYRQLGIYDNMLFYILVAPSTVFSGFSFLLLYGAFSKMPKTYTEAAKIDGAGDFMIMTQVIFPMILPTFFVLFILGFLSCWNGYAVFLIWMPSYPSLSYGLYMFQYYAPLYDATMPEILAGFMIMIIPTMILYISSQKLILSTFTVGGIKG